MEQQVEQERKIEAERIEREQVEQKAQATREREAQEKKEIIEKKAREVEEKNAAAQEHLSQYMRRIALLDVMDAEIAPIVESTDPQVKKIRLQVKKSVGEACNQISSQPSAIRLVVDKMCKLLDVRPIYSGF